jgi:hypothetical protein
MVGWTLTAVGVVSGKGAFLVAAAPFLVFVGVRALASPSAWSALARSSLRSSPYSFEYRERIADSTVLRLGTGGGLALIGLAWLILGLTV